MAGVINIRTRSGGDPYYVAGTAAGGSYGRQLYNAAVGADVGPVKLFVSGQHDEVKIAELLGPISAQFEDSDELQKRDPKLTGFRLVATESKSVPVGDMLPALIVAPLLTLAVAQFV